MLTVFRKLDEVEERSSISKTASDPERRPDIRFQSGPKEPAIRTAVALSHLHGWQRESKTTRALLPTTISRAGQRELARLVRARGARRPVKLRSCQDPRDEKSIVPKVAAGPAATRRDFCRRAVQDVRKFMPAHAPDGRGRIGFRGHPRWLQGNHRTIEGAGVSIFKYEAACIACRGLPATETQGRVHQQVRWRCWSSR